MHQAYGFQHSLSCLCGLEPGMRTWNVEPIASNLAKETYLFTFLLVLFAHACCSLCNRNAAPQVTSLEHIQAKKPKSVTKQRLGPWFHMLREHSCISMSAAAASEDLGTVLNSLLDKGLLRQVRLHCLLSVLLCCLLHLSALRSCCC